MYSIGKTLKKKNDIIFCILSSSSITLFPQSSVSRALFMSSFSSAFFFIFDILLTFMLF